MRHTIAFLLMLFPIMGFSQETAYPNPVDGRTYVAPGGWKTYEPKGGVKPSDKKVSLDGIRLLQSQDEIAARTTVEKLAAFIESARAAGDDVFSSYGKPAALLVQFTSAPGHHTVEIASQGEIPRELLQRYYDKLETLRPLDTTGQVRFQFGIRIAP